MGDNIKAGIELGFQVFTKDGGEEVGAVRDLCGHRPEIVVYVENGGEFVVPIRAIEAVHFQKVIVDPKKLPAEMQAALRHAHDAETE